tara:strand:+ start:2658 stop:4034 length:1377 start_codon:yes stop_codon:yes gene_type:complete
MYKYEFKEDDLFINRLKTYPEYDIFIYQGRHYINRERPSVYGTGSIRTRDGLKVYDINQNRADNNSLVYPFIRSSARMDDFKARMYNSILKNTADGGIYTGQNIPNSSFTYALQNKIALSGAYSGSVGITRTLTTAASTKTKNIFHRGTGLAEEHEYTYMHHRDSAARATNLTASALVNVVRKYSHLSKHYNIEGQDRYRFHRSGSAVTASSDVIPDRNMTRETVNMIFIPQMFYGSTIKKGSVTLNYYYTGSMLAACQDKNRNGELIGTSGSTTGTVVGIVLYNEGIIMLTSSANLESSLTPSVVPALKYVGPSGADTNSSWLYYGTTLNDGIGTNSNVGNASYDLKFKGTSYVTSMTMFAHAKKGHLNHSNNPTYRDLSESTSSITGKGETFLEELGSIKNVVSASYVSASFEKTTYISKVRLYDENNNLIGVASLANPVKKTMDRAYTFKLKLDI